MPDPYIDFFSPPTDIPIEGRIARFDHQPNEDDLGTWLGTGLIGSSSTDIRDEENVLTVFPRNIPIKIAAIWMYFIVTVIMIAGVYADNRAMLGIAIGGALFSVPLMLGMFWCFNRNTGDSPYLKLNKQTGLVELPRVEMTLPKEQLREVVFLNRFVDGVQYWQVALLCEDQGKWTYIHLYNEAGSGTGMHIFGCKEQYEQIAEHLGTTSRHLKFNNKDSEVLESYLAANRSPCRLKCAKVDS